MGTFMGHALPGTIFIIGGLWWAFNAFFAYYRARTKNGPPFRCRPWYSFPLVGMKNFPMDGAFKVALTSIGMIGELVTAFEGGHFVHIGNAQHMTMYFFFGLTGVLDILGYYRFPMPVGTEAAAGILAYSMEGLLFFFHLHGRSTMDKQVHMLLFYSIACCVLSIWIEIQYQTSLLATLCRAYFTVLQGTWFYQVAFILYPPFASMKPWEQENHDQMMIITLIYTWHCAVNFVIFLLIGFVIGAYYKCSYPNEFRDEIQYQSLALDDFMHSSKRNGHVNTKLMDSDSEGV